VFGLVDAGLQPGLVGLQVAGAAREGPSASRGA